MKAPKDLALSDPSRKVRAMCCSDQLYPPRKADIRAKVLRHSASWPRRKKPAESIVHRGFRSRHGPVGDVSLCNPSARRKTATSEASHPCFTAASGHIVARQGTNAELLLAFWASIGFKPADFMTTGM